jgi:uncharacterized membrane protein YgcG
VSAGVQSGTHLLAPTCMGMRPPFTSLTDRGSLYVFRDALPDLDTDASWDAVLETARSLESKPNFWLPLDAIHANEIRTPAERLVADLYHRCILPHVLGPSQWGVGHQPDGGGGRASLEPGQVLQGAEYWTQVYRNGRGLAFHVDKDEHAMKTRGEMINPVHSSVLYLTGGRDGEVLCRGDKLRVHAIQSPTVITDEHYDVHKKRMVPEGFPTESCLVFPKANRYCVFDGRAGHGVLDVNVDSEENPRGGSRSSSGGSSSRSSSSSGGGGGGGSSRSGSNSNSGTNITTATTTSDGNEDCRQDDVRVTFLVNWWVRKPEGVERDTGVGGREAGRTTPPAAAPPSVVAAQKEPVYTLSITKEYLFGNEPFMLDDFLSEQGILKGDRVFPVIIRHGGIVMVPFSPGPEAGRHIVDCALISQDSHSKYL